MFRNAAVVGAGAALGAAARLACTTMIGQPGSMWTLLAVNILGCFLHGAWRPGPFLGTGVLGGYTSFSAFTLVLVRSSWGDAALYLAATALGCVGAWLLGDALAARGAAGRRS
ncbi:fluoride efflux transporter family protein [Corynebacterium mastitidis]|uniref:fluoride efflux transporter family protein n=1 Tax=Corynebacterium mastitidis TaxID=161890 RepID=UPI0025508666|nr:fluoride efflux transporter family protein [Corynebacterium mastitidis]MDK8450830.1 fluoride efflux transporter family protein [Corynebacterium mastitidis]